MSIDHGDQFPERRNARPFVPILDDLNGIRGVDVTVYSEAWYATLSHFDNSSRDWIRHATGREPCEYCAERPGRGRWNAWVFCVTHRPQKCYLLRLTETSILYCPTFKQLHELSQLKGTHWHVWRSKPRKNAPMCIRQAEEPSIKPYHRNWPDLAGVVLSLFDRHAGPPGSRPGAADETP